MQKYWPTYPLPRQWKMAKDLSTQTVPPSQATPTFFPKASCTSYPQRWHEVVKKITQTWPWSSGFQPLTATVKSQLCPGPNPGHWVTERTFQSVVRNKWMQKRNTSLGGQKQLQLYYFFSIAFLMENSHWKKQLHTFGVSFYENKLILQSLQF